MTEDIEAKNQEEVLEDIRTDSQTFEVELIAEEN